MDDSSSLLLAPVSDYEGARELTIRSPEGAWLHSPARAVQDPAVLCENDTITLFWIGAGELTIAAGRLMAEVAER